MSREVQNSKNLKWFKFEGAFEELTSKNLEEMMKRVIGGLLMIFGNFDDPDSCLVGGVLWKTTEGYEFHYSYEDDPVYFARKVKAKTLSEMLQKQKSILKKAALRSSRKTVPNKVPFIQIKR